MNLQEDSNSQLSGFILENNDYIPKEDLYNILRNDIPQCYICLSTQSQKVRLFKWPRDKERRKSWCDFFEVDEEEILADFGNTFICSLHFDPSQFLYVSGKIFWKSDVSPLIVDPDSLDTKCYPWEKEESLKNIFEDEYKKLLACASKAFSDNSVITIGYRESNFRPTGVSKKHPVVILRDIRYPYFYYEFSHNRTNSRGTDFYYCLTCKKMKDKTGIKDNVRTISISDGRVVTSAHPFIRHHSHCSPGIEADEFMNDTGIECSGISTEVANESSFMDSKNVNNCQKIYEENHYSVDGQNLNDIMIHHNESSEFIEPSNDNIVNTVRNKKENGCRRSQKHKPRRYLSLYRPYGCRKVLFCCICLQKFKTVPELANHLTTKHQ
uniref:THAP-type domain-containing protein n=1 Tax=Strongyloides papillosus TaxID=174720 RepID=A0A0N5B2F5_STREA